MKKISLILFLIFNSLCLIAQNITRENLDKEIKPLNEKIRLIQVEKNKLEAEVSSINFKLQNFNKIIEKLKKQTDSNTTAISQKTNELGIKIKETSARNDGEITKVSELLGKNSLYGIIGVLSAILLSAFIYWILNKKQLSSKSDFVDQLNKTKSSIEVSLINEFGKQTLLMDTQLHLIEQQKNSIPNTLNLEPDHSLALKLANQINVMENNLNRMDQDVKGLKTLRKSISTLKDNLIANGYEMPELLGKSFSDKMKVIVTSTIPDENFKKDTEVITKVLIPQVNYNDKMIQTAQIETSKGY
jgi:septal ring factor EnvC (AmiA/AmiB activator)